MYTKYTPRRPVRSFRDLEIYQLLLGRAACIFRYLSENNSPAGEDPILEEQKNNLKRELIECAIGLPKLMAEAHSVRFSDYPASLKILDQIMLNCNRAIVYLELIRDLFFATSAGNGSATAVCNFGTEFTEEQIRIYVSARWKTMHLLRSWEKFRDTQSSEAKLTSSRPI